MDVVFVTPVLCILASLRATQELHTVGFGDEAKSSCSAAMDIAAAR